MKKKYAAGMIDGSTQASNAMFTDGEARDRKSNTIKRAVMVFDTPEEAIEHFRARRNIEPEIVYELTPMNINRITEIKLTPAV